ncbi:MAG: class I SAM-dependent methyltransferase [Gemmataceae bacterium]|nr:class I SAM-dependent methyltransferase [Gemmataceae bacterium]
MNSFLHGVARAASETFSFPEPLVEIGARQALGQENFPSLRSLFPGKEYLGIDLQPGQGIDLVGNVEDLPLENETVGSVIALNLFEHVRQFWKGFEEIHRVLRPGGMLFVSCPFFLHRHAYPNDYWRFTPDAFSFLLEPYPHKLIGMQGPRNKPLQVWAVAVKGPAQSISADTHVRFKRAMKQYAHEPVNWVRKLRYLLARMVCGRRPLAPFLDVNRFETVVLGNTREAQRDSLLFNPGAAGDIYSESETRQLVPATTPPPAP